jgi:uncharacterized membrane protein
MRSRPEQARRWLIRGVIATAVLVLVGLGALWPRGAAPDLGSQPNTFVDATITDVIDTTCQAVEVAAPTSCELATVALTSGGDDGGIGQFIVRETDFGVPRVSDGDHVVLLDVDTSPAPYRYSFVDFQRSTPMWWLLGAFVVVVVAFGRWQGARALLGLAASALLLAAFVIPALLRDEPAIVVALVGTVAIAFLALYLAHGVNIATTVALAGTLVSLACTVVLALVIASWARLSGLANDEAQVLRVTANALDLRGLLVAGIVVGALGVLDDVTVTQVSTVAALRRANPIASRAELWRDAIHVGRDHIASTVNTLVLAYAGAALPLLLLFAQGSKPFGRILTSEVVSVEVVRMLVGSIGLVLAVPITTALACIALTEHDEATHDHHHATGAAQITSSSTR